MAVLLNVGVTPLAGTVTETARHPIVNNPVRNIPGSNFPVCDDFRIELLSS
jgi:hypothetical protein